MNYAFDGHTISYSMFGLAMVFLGFLLFGFLILLNNRLKFLSLGYVGKNCSKHPNMKNTQTNNELSVNSTENQI